MSSLKIALKAVNGCLVRSSFGLENTELDCNGRGLIFPYICCPVPLLDNETFYVLISEKTYLKLFLFRVIKEQAEMQPTASS